MNKEQLIGKTVTALYKADDNQALKFEFEGGETLVLGVDGDCCSCSWIENVENPEALIGSPIVEADDIDMPDHGDKSEDEVIQYYGFKFSTVKGTTVLDYRNSSNGYYGGNLVWPGDYHYGGVFGQNNSKENWEKLA